MLQKKPPKARPKNNNAAAGKNFTKGCTPFAREIINSIEGKKL
jgi:hypothetical protein